MPSSDQLALRLPAEMDDCVRHDMAVEGRVAVVSAPAIYVVENDASVRDSLRALLESCGYVVRSFADADSCMAAMAEVCPQLLVVTVDLPGVNGVEMLERLRRNGDTVPSIMLASEGSVGMIVRAMRAGAVDCLEKPFFQSSLLRRIDEVLNQGPRPVPS